MEMHSCVAECFFLSERSALKPSSNVFNGGKHASDLACCCEALLGSGFKKSFFGFKKLEHDSKTVKVVKQKHRFGSSLEKCVVGVCF